MNARRLAAIVLIFVGVTVAWMTLGASIVARTQSGYSALGRQVVRRCSGWRRAAMGERSQVALPGDRSPVFAARLRGLHSVARRGLGSDPGEGPVCGGRETGSTILLAERPGHD